jgi:ribosome biogenesis protein SSF1/2
MNNFTSPASHAQSKVPRHLETLTTTVFQSLFPAINPQRTPLKSIKRVLLVNREASATDEPADGFVLNFRHYAITTRKASGISRAARKLEAAGKMLNTAKGRKGALPNLSRLQDIADYMMSDSHNDGYVTDATSASELDTDAEVEVLQETPARVLNAKLRTDGPSQADEYERSMPDDEHTERLAVKLVDLGPRMRLRLTKVEEGLCSGKVMWHEYLHKSRDEVRALDGRWDRKRQEQEARRRLQKSNVEKKGHTRLHRNAENNAEEGEDGNEDLLTEDDDYYSDTGDDSFDSEGLAGDAAETINASTDLL